MKKSKNDGITLVALIVTIIILLILAGVTIALLSGEDGILAKTEKAATSYETESIKEVVNLKLANLNASKWIDEGRKAALKDLNEFDNQNSANFDAEVTLKNPIQDSDTSAILIYDKHEIEVDSSLNIAKVDGAKQEESSGGTNEGSGSTEDGGNSSFIDSAEYAKMQETITQMQQEITDLKTQSATKTELEIYATKTELSNANNEITSNREQINNMLTTLDVDTRTTLFEGTAGTSNTTYDISNISDYKYLIVYADALGSGKFRMSRSSRMINVSDIVYNNSTTNAANASFNIGETSGTSNYSIVFWLRSSTQLCIGAVNAAGWTSPRIYKMEGIK